MDHRGEAEAGRVTDHPEQRVEDRAQHADQADQRATDLDHAAANAIEHTKQGLPLPLVDNTRLHLPDLVHEAGIVGGQARDIWFDAALGQAAAQPLDQPGPEGVEAGNLRNVDHDVVRAALEPFGVLDDLFEVGRMVDGPLAGRA